MSHERRVSPLSPPQQVTWPFSLLHLPMWLRTISYFDSSHSDDSRVTSVASDINNSNLSDSKQVWMSFNQWKPWEEHLKVTNCYVLASDRLHLAPLVQRFPRVAAGSQHWEKTLVFFFSRFRCESRVSVCVCVCELLLLYKSCIWHDMHIFVFRVNYVFVSAVHEKLICFMHVRICVHVWFFSDGSPRLTTFII